MSEKGTIRHTDEGKVLCPAILCVDCKTARSDPCLVLPSQYHSLSARLQKAQA